MKTVNIKGKDYIEVAERVKYFREKDDYKGWSIRTNLISNENGVCVFEATIHDENGQLRSSGHAYEKEDSTFINKTSYIENCETSAVGRALGFLGIGIDTSIASADEVQTAMRNQAPEEKSTKPATAKGIDFGELWGKYKEMSKEQLRKEYKEVQEYPGWSDKQREAVLNIISRCSESAE